VENDIILEINGQRINSESSLSSLLQRHDVGNTITLKIFHDDGERDVKVTLEEMK